MPNTSLVLHPSHGDETVNSLRFVLRGGSAEEAAAMGRVGMGFIPGQDEVSGCLFEAYLKAAAGAEPGKINVITVPPEFYVGYAAFSTAYISRAEHSVAGAPIKYAAARKGLALYTDADTETARTKLESAVLEGMDLATQPSYTIVSRNILGSFAANHDLHAVLTSLEVSIRAFEQIDAAGVEHSLRELFDCREPAQVVLVPPMIHQLVVQMAESVILSELRMMRWQGLALLGYKFHEGKDEVSIAAPGSIEEHRLQMKSCHDKVVASELLSGELAWLKAYAARQLELMRIELDGAELEAA